jgi:hypothetical protein
VASKICEETILISGKVTLHLNIFIGFERKILKKIYKTRIAMKNRPIDLVVKLKPNVLSKETGKKVKINPPTVKRPSQIVIEEKRRTFVTSTIETLYIE